MKDISVIGCGRWGTFLAWYAANRCQDKIQNVLMYDLKTSPNFIELRDTRKNEYLALSDNMYLFDALDKVLVNDTVIISIGCQHLRSLARELNGYDLNGKTFLLAMKGLEEPSAKIMHDVFREEVKQNVHVAVLSGPGHVQDYMKNVPSAAVIDSLEEGTKDYLIKLLQSDLIRFYYGSDLIGNQIGAALKNVIGLAAGILDGLEWYGLKGALMAPRTGRSRPADQAFRRQPDVRLRTGPSGRLRGNAVFQIQPQPLLRRSFRQRRTLCQAGGRRADLKSGQNHRRQGRNRHADLSGAV